jgi:hypothetical protein
MSKQVADGLDADTAAKQTHGEAWRSEYDDAASSGSPLFVARYLKASMTP